MILVGVYTYFVYSKFLPTRLSPRRTLTNSRIRNRSLMKLILSAAGLEVTAIAFHGQLSNMLGEKRAGVAVKKESECRPICKQLRQLIKRYPY
jgi:hypothetical protein